jgi:bifunctional UDP-N-acetylglucosamine pyrophosphorylase/glucosamine-1-phosphate N-acetyltransferase
MTKKGDSGLVVLILAAGQGTRLRSKKIKLLHDVAFRPMVTHVAEIARKLRPQAIYAVVGHQSDEVSAALAEHCDGFVLQPEQRGTGHAVLQARSRMRKHPGADLLILNGDVPTLNASTLRNLARRHRKNSAALSVLSATLEDATGYGRIVRDGKGAFTRIVEHKDASGEERRIGEINSGLYCADSRKLFRVLAGLKPDNAQGEYYLPDAVRILRSKNETVLAVEHTDPSELLGVNTRQELVAASRTLFDRKATALQVAGVTIHRPESSAIDPRAKIARDTVLWPNITIEGNCVIGEDCTIRSGSRLHESRLGTGVEIKDHSVVLESRIDRNCAVGPFAHLRPGTILHHDVKVGNFVETKKAILGPGAKASHLSYLGDAEIGEASNIGAGTITCNYDGEKKHLTRLGKRVFVGSDTQLVAPVTLEDDVYIGAGSTITKDVPSDTLAISRGRQTHISNWSERKKTKSRKKKPATGSKNKR